MTTELVNAITEMREKDALQLTEQMLAAGKDPMEIMDAAREAMEFIGHRFEEGKYFIPELVMGGEMMQQIAALVKPKMAAAPAAGKVLGKVVIGTVAGDIHDIGKDIVVFMLDVNGFQVHDLGIDVAAKTFVEKIKEVQPEVVGLSGFLTFSYDEMRTTIDNIREAGLRDKVKVMIGGGMIDEKIRAYTGADAYGTNAMTAVTLVKGWVGAA